MSLVLSFLKKREKILSPLIFFFCLALCPKGTWAASGKVPSSSRKDIELYVGGEKYSSLTAYKRAGLKKQLEEKVFSFRTDNLEDLLPRLMDDLPASFHKFFSREELVHIIEESYGLSQNWAGSKIPKFVDTEPSVQTPPRPATEKDKADFDQDMKQMLEAYTDEYGEEEAVTMNPRRMKTIIIPSGKE